MREMRAERNGGAGPTETSSAWTAGGSEMMSREVLIAMGGGLWRRRECGSRLWRRVGAGGASAATPLSYASPRADGLQNAPRGPRLQNQARGDLRFRFTYQLYYLIYCPHLSLQVDISYSNLR
jgi:hypothetical protein